MKRLFKIFPYRHFHSSRKLLYWVPLVWWALTRQAIDWSRWKLQSAGTRGKHCHGQSAESWGHRDSEHNWPGQKTLSGSRQGLPQRTPGQGPGGGSGQCLAPLVGKTDEQRTDWGHQLSSKQSSFRWDEVQSLYFCQWLIFQFIFRNNPWLSPESFGSKLHQTQVPAYFWGLQPQGNAEVWQGKGHLHCVCTSSVCYNPGGIWNWKEGICWECGPRKRDKLFEV